MLWDLISAAVPSPTSSAPCAGVQGLKGFPCFPVSLHSDPSVPSGTGGLRPQGVLGWGGAAGPQSSNSREEQPSVNYPFTKELHIKRYGKAGMCFSNQDHEVTVNDPNLSCSTN